jgi:hypothetical protein
MAKEAFQLSDSAVTAYEDQKVKAMFGPLARATLAKIQVNKNDAILDLACGTGIVARSILDKVTPAQPRGMAWKGAGGWLIFSYDRQVNFSRTVWITFHWRGTTSSVSVISSPIFTMRSDPQQLHWLGASTTIRSRGRWSGKGLRRVKLRTVLSASGAACSAASTSSVAAA